MQYQMSCQLRNVTKHFATLMTFGKLRCILVIYLLCDFEAHQWLETFSAYFEYPLVLSRVWQILCVLLIYAQGNLVFFLENLKKKTKITFIFLGLVIRNNMNIKIPDTVKSLEAVFTLQPNAAWFFSCNYISLQCRSSESRNRLKVLIKGFSTRVILKHAFNISYCKKPQNKMFLPLLFFNLTNCTKKRKDKI